MVCETREIQKSTQQASPLIAVTPGTVEIISSSSSLPWQGFLVEKHRALPGPSREGAVDWHVISLIHGHSVRVEERRTNGLRVSYSEPPGTLTMLPPGTGRALDLLTTGEFVHCAIDPEFVRGVSIEMGAGWGGSFQAGVRDRPIERIVNLLLDEVEAAAPSGKLYVESLVHALATRYLRFDGSQWTLRGESRVAPLPGRILSRVRERIETSVHADLCLDTLATESGYSRAHFLRMFQAAMGFTPHQYVVNRRLHRAQELLRRKVRSIIDVAAECGFSSQSHMTTVFKKHLGVTPAEFRRCQQR